jgi:hypothetical protein
MSSVRGCRFRCSIRVAPHKEGRARADGTIAEIGGRRCGSH